MCSCVFVYAQTRGCARTCESNFIWAFVNVPCMHEGVQAGVCQLSFVSASLPRDRRLNWDAYY